MKLTCAFAVVASLVFGLTVCAAQEVEPYHITWNTVEPKVEEVPYTDGFDDDFPLLGYVSIPEVEEGTLLPAVVILPDWSGVDDYEKVRATMMAEEFGWIGFAADIFGPDYQGVENSTIRGEQATIYRSNNTLFAGRIQSAIDLMASHPAVDPEKIGVIGYCFGGTGVLTHAFLGGEGTVGGVSFHGGLTEFELTTNVTYPVVVLSGGSDDTGTDVEFLESQLNEANATWQITRYSGVEHAFTKWDDERYNEVADHRSWREMATFLSQAFGEFEYGTIQPDSTDVTAVEYEQDGFSLTGWLAIPASSDTKLPAVVIVPDWDGVSGQDGYESQRATLLAQEGYIAMAADIYGSDLQQVDDFDKRAELTTLYRTDYELFVARIQAAVDVLKNHELVDPENILMIGYCFGGTGSVNYAFAGLEDVKAVVPFHGGLTSLAPIETDAIYPYVLVQSGGEDDAHGNNTELEMALDSGKATWEITRYSDVFHGFTAWESDAYNEVADWRSWDAMLQVFDMILNQEEEETDDETPSEVACTLEVQTCPDGSTVGRTGPDCEFEECPVAVACASDVRFCPDGTEIIRTGPDCEFEECPELVACPDDLKTCPDGSNVVRTGPDCEFEECPDVVACPADILKCPDGSEVGRTGPDCEFEECPNAVACPLDIRTCPDGSEVGRTGPDCKFEECPKAVACPLDIRTCPDGSQVGRTGPDCKFEECPKAVACPADIRGCPDGSYVSRTAPDCEFEECPAEAVTLPANSDKTILDLAEEAEDLSTLEDLLDAADLNDALSGQELYTVLAPIDDAFDEIDYETLMVLLEDPEGELTDILLFHVVPGVYTEDDLEELLKSVPESSDVTIPTLYGQDLAVTTAASRKGGLMINGANILQSIEAKNGVVHLIDKVLIPVEEGVDDVFPLEESLDEATVARNEKPDTP